SLLTSKSSSCLLFFFKHPETTTISTLSLHDALPICHHFHEFRSDNDARLAKPIGEETGRSGKQHVGEHEQGGAHGQDQFLVLLADRKSTRLNSSHDQISYAVFCLKKKNYTHLKQDHI